jgi:DNA-directed RNA polymerase subunit L
MSKTTSPLRIWAASVSNFTVTRRVPDAPELKELFGLDEMPLAEAAVSLELHGVPTAVVNGFRRAATDEIAGWAFQVPEGGFRTDLTTDVFMLPQFVVQRLELIPLHQLAAPQAAAAGLRFELNARNASAAPLTVYAGDLRMVAPGGAGATAYTHKGALFNPTTEIAVVQPGKTLVVEDISIVAGRGHAMFQVATCGCYTHLDIAQYSDEEMRLEAGVAADLSGYKESCLVSDPRSHQLRFTLQATDAATARAAAVATLAAVCENLRARLRLVAAAVEGGAAEPASAVSYAALALEGGLLEGVVRAPGETHTIGELLRRAIFDTAPEVAVVAYSVSAHERALTLTVRATTDVGTIITEAVLMALAAIEDIRRAL